jgi:hypothetical protein
MKKSYFVMSHEYSPILYCLTLFLYFIFSRRFSVIIVLHRAHEDAHLICVNFVSCHVHYYLFYFKAPADYYILIFGAKKLP